MAWCNIYSTTRYNNSKNSERRTCAAAVNCTHPIANVFVFV